MDYLLGRGPADPALYDGQFVTEMDDGRMGSLSFLSARSERRLGRTVGECRFCDEDGVEVVAALLLDQYDELFELDIWKVNFEPLIGIPEIPALAKIDRQG